MISQLEETLAYQIKVLGLPEPQREYKFCETRKWKFDFAWPDRMIAVEVEGGVFSGGRHLRPIGFIHDAEKYNAAAIMGWCVLRFPGEFITSGKAIAMIEEVLR